jgi:hypothetical protein
LGDPRNDGHNFVQWRELQDHVSVLDRASSDIWVPLISRLALLTQASRQCLISDLGRRVPTARIRFSKLRSSHLEEIRALRVGARPHESEVRHNSSGA